MKRMCSRWSACWIPAGAAAFPRSLLLAAATFMAGCQLPSGNVTDDQPAIPPTPERPRSPLTHHYELDKRNDLFHLNPHRATYATAHYTTDPNQASSSDPTEDVESGELQFQFSIKTKLFMSEATHGPDVWLAYTQTAHWQVLQTSGPFRETNYEPELFATLPLQVSATDDLALRFIGVGGSHHSNGQGGDRSRSWNRLFGLVGADWGGASLVVRPWWRIPETNANDENQDIDDFMGDGDVTLSYRGITSGGQSWIASALLRNNLGVNNSRGGYELTLALPLWTDRVKLFTKYFYGYGESLIDYNHRQQTFAFGIALSDWD